jgi:glyoxylase-like metal-dependent hydrolase (beta-lactamase superfamily II)
MTTRDRSNRFQRQPPHSFASMGLESTGQLNTQAAVRRFRMDDVTFTFIADGAMALAPHAFIKTAPPTYWAQHPEHLDGQGWIVMSAGGLLVERDGHRVLIDAGFGPAAATNASSRVNCGSFLHVLTQLGLAPSDIDTFALTHLHVDHTGWAFVESASGRREPTFPNATYLLATLEWQSIANGQRPPGVAGEQELIQPLHMHTALQLIGDNEEVAPGVTTVVTPGHSAGHTSYLVETSKGNRLIAFGDCFHTPAQLLHPEWFCDPDINPAAVPKARQRLLDELRRENTVGFAVHFGDQQFGTLVGEADTLAWRPLPTTVLFPPPRAL